jgi:diadenylate cyclase
VTVYFTGKFHPTDLLDIFIITLFLYSLFYLFRKSRSYLILTGLIIVTLLYFLAKTFNLYLTSLALQYFFGISVVMFIIIFQPEIRKYFELVGLIGTRQIHIKPISVSSPFITALIQACVKMAKSKTGALIIIRGIDNLNLYTEGGIPVDGLVSEELLLSIFDPHSEGHDGAVIIDNNRIASICTQLPLSNNFKEINHHSTRHSAALGLSENTDALCLVVSEEKGTISVCRRGKMKTLDNYSALEKEVTKYIRDKFSPPSGNIWFRFFTKNLKLKTAALVSAVVIWLFTAYRAGIVSNVLGWISPPLH